MSRGVVISLRPTLQDIPRIAEAVEDFFSRNGLPDKPRLHLTLALDELATNALTYGYPGGAVGENAVVIRLRLEGDVVVALLEDGGVPFDPFTVQPPDTTLGIDERRIGGLGLHFVRELMDEISYERDGSINRLTLRKRLSGSGPAQTDG